MTKKHNKAKALLGAALLIIIGLGVYIGYDNSQIAVKEQDVYIENLPQSFEGFRILQISDLHGKFFDKKQLKLINAVNRLDYDMAAFTGDMNRYEASNAKESEAVLTLINGMENRELLFWVDGNTGPFAMESLDGARTGRLTEMGRILSAPEYGCKVLLEPYAIERDGQRIWITPELSARELEMTYGHLDAERAGGQENLALMKAYGEKSGEWLETLKGNDEVKICLTHYPLGTNLSDEEWQGLGQLDYSLILAGHYHGGQFRIPGYGALYIPNPASGHGGYFPDQKDVMGLNDVNGIPQYISAGLGTSSSLRVFSFRTFNTPELNLIILRGK